MIDLFADDLWLLPVFLSYWLCSLGLLGAFTFVYLYWTPYKEVSLIREGNVAAACSLGGAVLGFVAALAFVVANSAQLHELLFWGVVASIIQLVAYSLVRFIIPNLPEGIAQNKLAYGLFLGLVAFGLGVLNGACMVP
jgi:putative membrane protein